MQPLHHYRPPAYPTRDIVTAHPELLRLLPRRWRGNTLVAGALASACLIVSARWSPALAGKKSHAAAVPIFVHSSGRVSYGCMAIAAPTFLSEDEARHVVNNDPDARVASLLAARRREMDIIHRIDILLSAKDNRTTPPTPISGDLPLRERASLASPLLGREIFCHLTSTYSPSSDHSLPSDPGHADRLLRERVRDFIAWLKAQGIL